MTQKSKFILGQRYTYPEKDYCLRVANKAKAEGYDVKFGTDTWVFDGSEMYWFEIVDPFKEGE